MTMHIDGRCHCGEVRYEAEIDPDHVGICHCTDCQMLSGSAYRVSALAPAATFRLLAGQPRAYVKTADNGSKRRHAFCGTCGTPVNACADVPDPPTYSLRVGCLDQRRLLVPKRRIWCGSALAWSDDLSDIPGIEKQ